MHSQMSLNAGRYCPNNVPCLSGVNRGLEFSPDINFTALNWDGWILLLVPFTA